MARRSVTILAAAHRAAGFAVAAHRAAGFAVGVTLAAAVVGCGTDGGSTSAGTATGTGTIVTLFAPESGGGDGATSFVALAEEAAEGYRVSLEEAGRTHAGAEDDDGRGWWVNLDVDVPLTEADLDDPLAALPPVLAPLAPEVRSVRILADSPRGPIQVLMDTPIVGLRSELDGSHQVVTTVPGDEPPATATWAIAGARLTRLSVPVAAVDQLVDPDALIAEVGADRITIGPPDTGGYLALDDALAGVPPTAPPRTGTYPPPPATDPPGSGEPTTATT